MRRLRGDRQSYRVDETRAMSNHSAGRRHIGLVILVSQDGSGKLGCAVIYADP